MSKTPFHHHNRHRGTISGKTTGNHHPNAEHLPRFQSLCERFGFKPVYLTNYEIAMSDVFVEFARDVLRAAPRGRDPARMELAATLR